MLRTIQQLFHYITRDKDILYVFCPCSIGDILINGGFCHAILKKKRKKTCVLIEHDRYAKNYGLINFVGVMDVMHLPNNIAGLIQQYIYATREYETDNCIYGHFKMGQSGYISNEKLSFINRYKENVFGLPMDTELLPPIIDAPTDYQKQRLHEIYILDKERTIIIMPYASGGTFEESFWIKLVSELKQKNKDRVIYTNVASPSEKIIPGTAPIVTTFQELVYLAEKVNCFVGHRSGIFDLLAFTNAKLLYMNREVENWWYFDLNLNFNHINSRAFYITSASEQAGLETFMQQNNISSIDDVNFYGRVLGRDVALNMDSLLEKIIDAVD